MSRTRTLLLCGAAALALATASPESAQAANRFEVALTGARVDRIGTDTIVASFDAGGDVRGLFTATIALGANGALKGEWVLVSRYLRDLTPDGQLDVRAQDERAALPGAELHTRHKEYFEIHERGTLRGSIAGGALSFDVDGRLRGIDALQLTVEGGDREFKDAAGGGSLTGSNLQTEAGVGALSLDTRAAATQGVK